jgi:hypothetical protein
MRLLEKRTGFAIATCVLAAACARAPNGGAGSLTAAEPKPAPAAPAGQARTDTGETAPALRRLVKKAALRLTVDVPSDTAEAATRIVEQQGGFVATSELEASAEEDRDGPATVVLVLRVPAEHFSAALSALRHLSRGVGSENVTTDDVSEEFIDLDARIHNQRELEAQFLEILKRAGKVEDALNVQREIAGVRTEIERMEGRRRFLDRETALSTITLTLVRARPLVSASLHDFSGAVTRAGSDSVNVAAGLATGSIRIAGVMLPIALFFGAPVLLMARWLRRRRNRARAATSAAAG